VRAVFLEEANVQFRPRQSLMMDFASPARAETGQLTDAAGGYEDAHVGESLLIILVVGLIAGWLAGQIVQGAGFGIVGDPLS
jgi:hypothetical protein